MGDRNDRNIEIVVGLAGCMVVEAVVWASVTKVALWVEEVEEVAWVVALEVAWEVATRTMLAMQHAFQHAFQQHAHFDVSSCP